MGWIEKQAEALAVSAAASAAHPECSARYRDRLTAAEQRRLQAVADIQTRHAAFLAAAKSTYDQVLEVTADDDLRNATNAAYAKATADADAARDEEIAAATAEEAAEKCAAYREYRASPGYMGEV